MTTRFEGSEAALLRGLAEELLAEFPASSRGRGWMIGNLEHLFERIDHEPIYVDNGDEDQEPWTPPPTIREMWKCDVYGPSPYSHWQQFAGGRETSLLRMESRITGSLESPTPEGLILMARQFVEQAGLA